MPQRKVRVFSFDHALAREGRPLPLLDELVVELPDDYERARSLLRELVASKTGRRLHSLSMTPRGPHVAIVMDEAFAKNHAARLPRGSRRR